jgi:acyl-CoA synthetase (AMP-forming)/AMP-acid ligase II
MFKVKGATVYPAEVESALTAVDGVRQAYVTRVPVADGVDAVGAVVVSALTAAEVAAAVAGRLSSFKVPGRWLVLASVDEVPKTATGKVAPSDLRDLLLARGQEK